MKSSVHYKDIWKRAWENRQLQIHLLVGSVVAANGEDLDLLGQSEAEKYYKFR